MARSLARVAFALVFAAPQLAVPADAQSFFIDIGANVAFPTPSVGFPGAIDPIAAAAQWDSVSGTLIGTQLLDGLDGVPTSVSIQQSGGALDLDFDNAATSGDQQSLLDDAQAIAAVGTTTWTLNGLVSGAYRVVVYAWAPDNPTGVVSQVNVVGGALGPRACGGAAFSGFRFGVTHVADTVQVASGSLVIQLNSVSGVGRCNGFQIEFLGASFGAVLRGPFDLTSITGRGDHLAIGAYSGDYFVVGSGAGGATDSLYRIATSTLVSTLVTGVPICPLSRDLALRPCVGPITRIVYSTDNGQKCRYEYSNDVLLSCAPVLTTASAAGIALGTSRGNPNLDSVLEHAFFDDGTGAIVAQTTGPIGAATTISASQGFVWEGLGRNPVDDRLWGFARFNAVGGANLLLVAEIDPRDGQLTGKAFQGTPRPGAPDVAGGCDIHIDPVNPSRVSLAVVQVSTTGSDQLVVYDLGDFTPLLSVYCTATTSSSGCVPGLSGSGSPSASLSSGFVVSASNVEGQRAGLFFYGACGRAVTPFGAGLLCVKSPVQRTTPQSSGGSFGACDGALSIDWLAFVAANPSSIGAPHVAGSTIDIQGWYRDPPAPKTSNLTNALTFTLIP